MLLPSLVALALAGLGVALLPRVEGDAWLAALFFWSGVPAGSIGFVAMMRLVGGRWREALGPAMLRGLAGLPGVVVATIPLRFMLAALYPWADAPPAGFKGAWLAPLPFVLRTLLWLGGLAGFAWLLRRGAGARVAVAALLFVFPMGSLIAVDWLLSLDPAFHSSGFGLQALMIQFTVALMIAVLRAPPDPSGTTGALMLTVLMLWGYLAYLPFFIVWSGNAPAGAAWYLARGSGGWGLVAALAAVPHVVGVLALLSARLRRSAPALRAIALAVLAGNALQAAWLVLPVRGPVSFDCALYLLALALIGAPTLLAPASSGARR